MNKQLSVTKHSLSVFFFFALFMTLCFVDLETFESPAIYVFHFNFDPAIATISVTVLFAFVTLLKKPYMDRIAAALLYCAALGLIPLTYVDNLSNSYWGNYFALLMSLLAYYICVNSKIDFSEKVYKVLCIVCVIISIQVIATEMHFFSALSFGNFNDVVVKLFMVIPLGGSNLIAAFLLPMIVFIVSFKRSKLTFAVSALSLYAMFLCRSKTAINLVILLLFLMAIMKVYRFIINDHSVSRKTKLVVLIVVTSIFGGLSVLILKLVGSVVTDLQNYGSYSQYSNATLNYLDTITSGRISVFDNQLTRFFRHFIFGNGFSYQTGQLKSHNWIIELLVQRGVIGFLVYLFAIVQVFKNGRKYYKNDPFTRASVNLLSIIYIQGLFEITVTTIGMDFLIWSVAGFLIARTRHLSSQTVLTIGKKAA